MATSKTCDLCGAPALDEVVAQSKTTTATKYDVCEEHLALWKNLLRMFAEGSNVVIELPKELLATWLSAREASEMRIAYNYMRAQVPEIPEGYRAVVEVRLEPMQDIAYAVYEGEESLLGVPV